MLRQQVDKGASCCLFPHSQSDPSTPYWRSSPNMKARADHDQRLENIREFKPLCRQFACTNPSTGNQYERTVSTLEDGKFLDLNCKVVGTSLEEVGQCCAFDVLLASFLLSHPRHGLHNTLLQ